MYGLGMLKGMRMTLRRALQPVVTELYPFERRELSPRARSVLAMRVDADGAPDCKACTACEKACPDHVITLRKDSNDPKRLDSFVADHGRCTFCGLCVEACPAGLHFAQDFDFSSHDKADLEVTLIDNGAAAGGAK